MVNGINSAQIANTLTSNSSAQYPENLAKICESCDPNDKNYGKYTTKQMEDAFNKINAREYAAFGHLAGDATPEGIVKFAQAYVNYYNQLSPEEQNSQRYKGTGASAAALLAGAKGLVADEKAHPGKNKQPESLLMMLLNEMLAQLKKHPAQTSTNTSATSSSEQVTISVQAQKLSGVA